MARRRDTDTDEGRAQCDWCEPGFCRAYVRRTLKLRRDHDYHTDRLGTAVRMHHYLTMPSESGLAGHLRESYGYNLQDDTGRVKGWCEWYRTMHELWGGKVDSEGSPMSTADTWLGEKLVKALKLRRPNRGGLRVVPGHRQVSEIEDSGMFEGE